MEKLRQLCISAVVTFFWVGKTPIAPGTWGSLAGLLLFYLSHLALLFWVEDNLVLHTLIYSCFIIAVTAIGTAATHSYIKNNDQKDPKEVVIDEVAGQLIASYGAFLFFITYQGLFDDLYAIRGSVSHYLLYMLTIYPISFLLFRLFDIWKPGPIGWCDKNLKGAWGVMADDCLAGLAAAIVSIIIAYILCFTETGLVLLEATNSFLHYYHPLYIHETPAITP